MPKTPSEAVTLTATNDTPASAPAPDARSGVLAFIEEATRKLETDGDHASAGLLHNLAVRFGELKKHINDVAGQMEGDVMALLKRIHDDL